MTALWRTRTTCRVCAAPLGPSYLHLGTQPLANALVEKPDPLEMVAPLAVTLCKRCGLSQLTVTVEPSVLYTDYPFVSGTTAPWHDHCKALVQQCGPKGMVVDLAANDGTLLKHFMDAGWNAIGVEPSNVESAVVTPYIREFFTQEIADGIVAKYGKANIVTAQNVLGHVDDPTAFLKAARSLLAPHGKVVVEVPHVLDLIEQGAFDTIYHEHLNYWNTPAMTWCARQAGLALQGFERLDVHGGSRRYWFTQRGNEGYEFDAIDGVIDERPYLQFARDTDKKLTEIAKLLGGLKEVNRKVWAYGASAKGTVMLNALADRGAVGLPELILDDARSKQGRLLAGVHIPIKPPTTLRMLQPPDVLWILSWNWADELKARARALGFTGRFLVTTPTLEIG